MKQILVTGAGGFIGRILSERLVSTGWSVHGTLLPSENSASLTKGVTPVVIDPINGSTQWGAALATIDTVIHLAARVHVMKEDASDPLKEFREVNTDGTERLAREAAAAGVRRIIFMSTIGVNGNISGEVAFSETDELSPHNPYSVSKYEAELRLRQLSSQTGMEVVVIRAPLVYGPGNPGNFLSLLRIVAKGIPLPLASIKNRRSLIYVGNLVDALVLCASHPAAAGKTYLVSDGDDVSTPELIRRTAAAFGIKSALFPFPPALMRLAGRITGKVSAVDRLLGSLAVDSSAIRRELGWKPPFTMEQGLAVTAEWFLKKR